ncbi:hypothetical protein E8E13_010944 [Curvularia kusanoi]|uniref:Uncharacterized protein n=1 Tax=Curvularia kusanoi TaxID=90978 RepID=A0A9P4WB60_CURKU|nr:hypothetical protein E8E13_010944 [Curvularia kusanoi]
MVLSILIATLTAPALLGSQEAIRQGQSKDRREEHRARRCNLIASCVKSSPRSREIDGRPVVLRDGKLWIDSTTEDGQPSGHTYAGYYLPYPDTKYEGLVTTITEAAPIMNWVYVDATTHEVKYGVRADAQPNLTGPFDCTRQDRRLTFDGWEGWCAVEEQKGYWCLYFDVNDDGLKSKVTPGVKVLEIELSRKEKRFKRDAAVRQEDQTTKRVVKTEENVPVDQPVKQEPTVKRPGVFQSAEPDPEPTNTGDTTPRAPRTPPPAYSKSYKSTPTPTPNLIDKGAVGILDDFLATEAQAQVHTEAQRGQIQSKSGRATANRVVPLDERRTTPRLNRNSGSKTIAQAQIFEAMAASVQQRIEDLKAKRVSGTTRMSVASSSRDSISVYSEEGLGFDQEIRPQSSVSQRPDTSTTAEPAVNYPQSSNDDPAVFGPSVMSIVKRNSRASASSQPKRTPKPHVARRPGKRVSPRNSLRKSLSDTMSSRQGKGRDSPTTNLAFRRAPKDTRQQIFRIQAARKNASTHSQDLVSLANQETAPKPTGSSQ